MPNNFIDKNARPLVVWKAPTPRAIFASRGRAISLCRLILRRPEIGNRLAHGLGDQFSDVICLPGALGDCIERRPGYIVTPGEFRNTDTRLVHNKAYNLRLIHGTKVADKNPHVKKIYPQQLKLTINCN